MGTKPKAPLDRRMSGLPATTAAPGEPAVGQEPARASRRRPTELPSVRSLGRSLVGVFFWRVLAKGLGVGDVLLLFWDPPPTHAKGAIWKGLCPRMRELPIYVYMYICMYIRIGSVGRLP